MFNNAFVKIFEKGIHTLALRKEYTAQIILWI